MKQLSLVAVVGLIVSTPASADDFSELACGVFALNCLCAHVNTSNNVVTGGCLAPSGPNSGKGFSLQSRSPDGSANSRPISLAIGAIPEIMRTLIGSQSTLKGTSDLIKLELQRIESDVNKHVSDLQKQTEAQLKSEPQRVTALTEAAGKVDANTKGKSAGMSPLHAAPPTLPHDPLKYVRSWTLDAERRLLDARPVQSHRLLPDGPDLGGLLTRSRERDYASIPAGRDREIFSERRRIADSTAMQPGDVSDALYALGKAEEFAAAGSGAIADALVLQAKAYRYAREEGLSSVPTATVNPDDSISWGAPTSPDRVLVNMVRKFDTTRSTLATQRAELRRSITGDTLADRQRRAAIDISERLSDQAAATFYQGSFREGQGALEMAGAVLDTATRFIPGVSWGRDIIEAISGRDLFTGEKLDGFAQTVAILGAVTGGLGGEAFGALRILEKLETVGHSTERARGILTAGKSMVRADLKLSGHAIERMAERHISDVRLDKAIDLGTRFWDTQHESLVAIEKRIAPRALRVAAAINIDTKFVNNAMLYKDSDEVLEALTWVKDGKTIPRFIKLIHGD